MKAIENDILDDLIKKLEAVPAVKRVVSEINDNSILTVYTRDRTEIQLFTMEHAFPKQISQLLNDPEQRDQGKYALIMAPYISPVSADICKKNNAGYYDCSGNCLISLDSVFISDTGHKNLFPKEDRAKNIFRLSSKTSSKILRTLLIDVSATWKLSGLSEKVGCSIGMAARIKDYLCDQTWAVMDKEGIHITDPESLLHAWADAYSIDKDKTVNAYSLVPLGDFERRSCDVIKRESLSGCLTAFSGGVRYTPVVRYTKAHLWISRRDLHGFLKKTEIKPVESGANVTIYVADEDEIFIDNREIDGCITASPVQTYLDLMQQKGRGEEMAEAILHKEILK